MSKLNVKQAVPFFMVTDMVATLNFYIEKLGFTIKNKWEPGGHIEWCWLQLDNASVMLQQYKQIPSDEKLGEGVSVYFICEDALITYHQVMLKGLSIPEPFVGNNMWVVSLKDPDGYKIYFESPTAVPEETMYSDWVKRNKTS
jgi:lactoylglutathione lyase